MTSTLPPLVQAVAGAIGSASANTLTYPLDLATTRIQLQRSSRRKLEGVRAAFRILIHVARQYGVSALYDGIITDTGATILSSFFYFYFYSFLRKLVLKEYRTPKPKSIPNLTVIQELLLGFIAGVASRAVSMPLNIVTLRLQTERSDSDVDADSEDGDSDSTPEDGVLTIVKRIYDEQGLAGFWRGFKITTILSLNPSITLAFFQAFRRILIFTRPRALRTKAQVDPTPGEAFIGGALSNSIAVAILYPLILAKTRLQAAKQSRNSLSPSEKTSVKAPTLSSVLLDAYQGRSLGSQESKLQSSVKGLYQGLETQILKGFLSQGVTFLVKGRIEQLIVQAYLRRRRAT